AAMAEDDVEHVAERAAADEERQGLVLVRRPAGQLDEQERPHGERAGRDAGDEKPPVELAAGFPRLGGDADGKGGLGQPVLTVRGREWLRTALLALIRRADLRIPLSEWSSVRGIPSHYGPGPGGLRGLRRRAGRQGAASGAGPFQGIGLLLDRLRARVAKARRRRRGRRGEEGRQEAGEGSREEGGRRRQRRVHVTLPAIAGRIDTHSAPRGHGHVTDSAVRSG